MAWCKTIYNKTEARMMHWFNLPGCSNYILIIYRLHKELSFPSGNFHIYSKTFILIIYRLHYFQKLSAGKKFEEIARRNFSAEMQQNRAEIFSAEFFSHRIFFCRNLEISRRNFFRRNFWFSFLLVDENTYM